MAKFSNVIFETLLIAFSILVADTKIDASIDLVVIWPTNLDEIVLHSAKKQLEKLPDYFVVSDTKVKIAVVDTSTNDVDEAVVWPLSGDENAFKNWSSEWVPSRNKVCNYATAFEAARTRVFKAGERRARAVVVLNRNLLCNWFNSCWNRTGCKEDIWQFGKTTIFGDNKNQCQGVKFISGPFMHCEKKYVCDYVCDRQWPRSPDCSTDCGLEESKNVENCPTEISCPACPDCDKTSTKTVAPWVNQPPGGETGSESKSLQPWAVVVIAMGVMVFLALVVAAVLPFARKRRLKKAIESKKLSDRDVDQKNKESMSQESNSSIDQEAQMKKQHLIMFDFPK